MLRSTVYAEDCYYDQNICLNSELQYRANESAIIFVYKIVTYSSVKVVSILPYIGKEGTVAIQRRSD